jgi:hypothetical protein
MFRDQDVPHEFCLMAMERFATKVIKTQGLVKTHGLINFIETKAKCRHLKKFTCKGTLRQVFICLRLRTPYSPPPNLHTCIRV